ncbi:MAG TPA: hypothetical protein VG366_03290 [Solirubrobacteraceae bacterium]|nr:hypothetical protein [Solirubrobacteraceae bacterium]
MRLGVTLLAALCALALAACADTVQERPIPHNILEALILAPHTVYWLGGTFEGMALTEATRDPSGAYSVEYGACLEGGQGTCVPPLRVISSPDDSFLPGGAARMHAASIRSLRALVAQRGHTIILATGAIVVDIYADRAPLAAAAARAMVPINEPGTPRAPLPARLPDSGFNLRPLPSQVPAPLHPLG